MNPADPRNYALREPPAPPPAPPKEDRGGRSYLASSVIEAARRAQANATAPMIEGVVVRGVSRGFLPIASRLTALLGHDRIAAAVHAAEEEARSGDAPSRRIEAIVGPRNIVLIDCRTDPRSKIHGVPVGLTIEPGASIDVPAGCIAIEAKADGVALLFPATNDDGKPAPRELRLRSPSYPVAADL